MIGRLPSAILLAGMVTATAWRGAEGDNRLPGLRHFQTLIATPGRLYVAVDNNILAFAY